MRKAIKVDADIDHLSREEIERRLKAADETHVRVQGSATTRGPNGTA